MFIRNFSLSGNVFYYKMGNINPDNTVFIKLGSIFTTLSPSISTVLVPLLPALTHDLYYGRGLCFDPHFREVFGQCMGPFSTHHPRNLGSYKFVAATTTLKDNNARCCNIDYMPPLCWLNYCPTLSSDKQSVGRSCPPKSSAELIKMTDLCFEDTISSQHNENLQR